MTILLSLTLSTDKSSSCKVERRECQIFWGDYSKYICLRYQTSSQKGNNAHLRAIIHSEKKGQLTLWSVVGSSRISNSSMSLCMSSLPVSMKRIPSRTTDKKWQHCFSNYNIIWKPVVGCGRISNSSKLLCMSSLPANMKRIS